MVMKGSMKKRRRAFTLAELMITTAVIGIMAALITPALSRMIQSSKEAKALGVMRNVLRCASLSQAESGGIHYRKKTPSVGRVYWLQYFVTEYSDFNPQALRSPLDDNWDERLKTLSYPLLPSDQKTGFSYAMNMDLPTVYPDTKNEPSLFYVNPVAAQNVSRAALFFEAMGTLAGFRQKSDLKTHARFGFKDGEGIAVGFLDSHVEIVAKTDVLDKEKSSWTEEQRNIFWTGKPDKN